ncbi:uncharacterized protein LOC116776059 isoform X3 [Danaus plexippus]|uniref:uncharacterized protein LOC116776059 isoform X3 n=1 Tax=Danaus plexippus TaxID=13037 RepID=UPI002AB0836D|nr:uncharacterized protein LOC116776059 isoform X3 [Danaus plexippus]
MTSTNDGKDVKSNQISGPKSKTYFIELYKSLEARLSGDCSGEERARLLCESWRRVHSLCQHSAPTTQIHLLNWLQQHTARTILQTEWQSPKSKDHHTWLEEAIDEFIQECQNAISRREGGWSPSWENQLQHRALWFRSTLTNPWGHSVLKALLDSRGTQPSDEEVLEWLKLERAVMFVTRLRQLAASKCDDLALLLATSVMNRLRATTVDQLQAGDNTEQASKDSNFVKVLRKEAGFTDDVWNLITDIEFVLLYKGELRSRCIELAKQTPLHNGYQLVKRLHNRLELYPREKKLWKNAKEAATLVAEVVIARCMVVPQCTGAALVSLYGCASSLVRLLPIDKLPPAAAALAAPAATSRHLHTLAEAVHSQCKNEQTAFVCELYVRAITAGMNELERLKIKTEKESEARSTEQTLSTWFTQLGKLLSNSKRLDCECILTAFSVHPSAEMYERVKAAPILAPLQSDIQETKEVSSSEYGSWANDSRTQTNLVKTSETLNLKQTQKQANVLSTAILAEGEALGLGAELCQDLSVLISGPRVKTLSWDTDREQLLENCRTYMERTGGGTRALTTELRYLNLDPRSFQHLPEEQDDDSDMFYGIEKGYEHLVEFQEEPEEIWQDVASDEAGKSDSAALDLPLTIHRQKKTKTKRIKYSSEEESDPLNLDLNKVNEKKQRPHSKERKEKINVKQETKDIKETNKEIGKQKKKERKERKKKDKDVQVKPVNRPSGSLSRLVGMKVAGYSNINRNLSSDVNINMCVTDSDYDSQGKSSIASLNSEGNDPDVLFDGLFSMEDIKSPEKNLNDHIQKITKPIESTLSKSVTNIYGDNVAPGYRNAYVAANVNTVNEEVKNSIKKLIEFRRYKNLNDVRTETHTQIPSSNQNSSVPSVSPRYLSSQNNVILPASNSQNITSTNAPKVFLPKEKIKQLNALKDEVNSILQKTAFNRDKIGINEAAEKFLSSNTVINRPTDQTKASVPGVCVKKIEPYKNNDHMNINYRQLEKAPKKTTQCKPSPYRNPHHELVKQLQSGVDKTAVKKVVDSPSQIQFQNFLKATMSSHQPQQIQKSESFSSIYQNIPQRISNKAPNLIQRNNESKEKLLEQNVNHIASKSNQNISQSITNKQDSPSQRQFHNFLKDLQDSINAGASNDKQETKISSTHHCPKQMIPKKPDNVPKTFARMSYLKTKQCDQKLKPTIDKTAPNKCVQGKPVEHLQHLQPKGDIFISKIDITKPQDTKDKIILEKRDTKANPCAQSTTALRVVGSQQPISHILSSGCQKSIPNVITTSDIKFNELVTSSTAGKSFLSQKDQDDVLNLLRQKSILNSNKTQSMTVTPKSVVESNSTLNNKKPLIVSLDTIARNSNAINLKTNITVSEKKNTNEKPVSSSALNTSKTQNTSQTKKVRKVKEPSKNTKNSTQSSDWESVMDAILATKTPTRVYQTGPNALDIALNKDSFERCYLKTSNIQNEKKANTNITKETIKSNAANQKKNSSKTMSPTVKSFKITELKTNHKQCAVSSKPQTSIKNAAAPKTQTNQNQKPVAQKTQQISFESLLDLSKRDVSQSQTKPLPSVIQNRNDPFISGIKNSDYDLLEELMDDELRQEIGELSDEEIYNISLSNTAKYKNQPQTCESKKSNPVLNKNLHIQPQTNVDIFNNSYQLSDLNSKEPSRCAYKAETPGNKCTSNTNNAESKLKIISNEAIVAPGKVNNNINYYSVINKTASVNREQSEIKNICQSTPKDTNTCFSNKAVRVANSSSNKTDELTVKMESQTRNVINTPVQNSRFNILDSTRVVLTVPQRKTNTNVMLISNDYIYDPFQTIHVDDANVHGNVSSYNQNAYFAVNQVPNVAIYHTTQSTAPVVNPVLIENSIVLPVTVPVTQNISNVGSETKYKTSPTIQRDKNILNKSNSQLYDSVAEKLVCDSSFQNEITDMKSKTIQFIKTRQENDTNLKNSLGSQYHKTHTEEKSDNTVNCNRTADLKISDVNITSCKPKLTIDNEDTTKLNILNKSAGQNEIAKDSVSVDNVVEMNRQECYQKTMMQKLPQENDKEEQINSSNVPKEEELSRIYQKRLRILNRETTHRCSDAPIPLGYEPIKYEKKSETSNLKSKSSPYKRSITECTNKEVPKPACRRILLRSSNSLPVVKKDKSDCHPSNLRKPKLEKRIRKKFKSSHKYTHEMPKPNNATAAKNIRALTKTNNVTVATGISSKNNGDVNTKSQECKMIDNKLTKFESNDLSVSSEREHDNNIFDSHMNVDAKEKNASTMIPVITNNGSGRLESNFKNMDEIKEENIDNKILEECKSNKPLESIEKNSTLSVNSTDIKSKEKSNKDLCNSIKSACDFNKIDSKQAIKKTYKDKILFDELPNLEGDPSKRYIRIKLPNGSFKATISGKVNVNVESILEDPNIKAMLREKMNSSTKCILNIKQISVQSKDRPSFVKTQIQDVSYVTKDDPETINLISDDDEDCSLQHFETQFGRFKIASMDSELFRKHQRKLSQRCQVKLQRINNLNSKKRNEGKSGIGLDTLNKVESTNDLTSDDQKHVVDFIELDDSSNEIVELKTKKLYFTTIKDCLDTSKSKNSNDDLEFNSTSQEIKEKKPESVQDSDICETKNVLNEFELKECSLKIEKCDKLVKDYEHLKIKNRKCYVNLVRLDLADYYRNKTESSDFKYQHGLENRQLSEVLNLVEKIAPRCEQYLQSAESKSILNELSTPENDMLRISPSVIENCNIKSTCFEDSSTFNHINLVTGLIASNCRADWLITKLNIRKILTKDLNIISKYSSFEVDNVILSPDDISTDCDSDKEIKAESDVSHFVLNEYKQVDSLIKLTLDLLTKNSHILENLKTIEDRFKCQKVSNLSRKRKLDGIRVSHNCNKISKLHEQVALTTDHKIDDRLSELQRKRKTLFSTKNVVSLQKICCSFVNTSMGCLQEVNSPVLCKNKSEIKDSFRPSKSQKVVNDAQNTINNIGKKDQYSSQELPFSELKNNEAKSKNGSTVNVRCDNMLKVTENTLPSHVDNCTKFISHANDDKYIIENKIEHKSQTPDPRPSVISDNMEREKNDITCLDDLTDKSGEEVLQSNSNNSLNILDQKDTVNIRYEENNKHKESSPDTLTLNTQNENNLFCHHLPKEIESDSELKMDVSNENPRHNINMDKNHILTSNLKPNENSKFEVLADKIEVATCNKRITHCNALHNIKENECNIQLLNEIQQIKENLIEVAVPQDFNMDRISDKYISTSEILSGIPKTFRTSEDVRIDSPNKINDILKINKIVNSCPTYQHFDGKLDNKQQPKIKDFTNFSIKQKEELNGACHITRLAENKKRNSLENTLKEEKLVPFEKPPNNATSGKGILDSSDSSELLSNECAEKNENETLSLLEETCSSKETESQKKSFNIEEKTGDDKEKTKPESMNLCKDAKVTFSENKDVEIKPVCAADRNNAECFTPETKLSDINHEELKVNICNDRPKQKNVTLVYEGDSQVVLEGSIYEDPVVGTCYVFPIANRTSLIEENESIGNVVDEKSKIAMNHLKSKILETRLKEEININDKQDEALSFTILPKITYIKEKLKDDDFHMSKDKKYKRNLKRKIDVGDLHNGKKYRKGKNIDYPKLTISAINDLAYSKEYKRLFDYCSSVTFSYSRPFHIEYIDVNNLLKSWPIRGITVDNTEQTDFKNLLFVDEDVYKSPFDPMKQTFAEEITYNYNHEYVTCNINENNFRMGFGEGSDRVIKISEVIDNNSKFSAATLSDVKQAQPFLMSKDQEISKKKRTETDKYEEQKNIFKRYVTYIQLKEKVRSFFKNTALELNNSCLLDKKDSYKNNISHTFPYELTSPEFIKPSPFECIVQIVQVGQLPVSAAVQNPVTCDPRVTQVTDASPSQCSAENSPQDDSQPPIKTEYTELTTADIRFPLVQEYERHIEAQESLKASFNFENIPVETEIKTEIKDEIPDFESVQNDCNENNVLQSLVNKHINNVEYPYDSSDNSEVLNTPTNPEIMYDQEIQSNCDFIPEQEEHNNSSEKTDQIAHAMNAAGITTTPEISNNTETTDQNVCQEGIDDASPSPNDLSKSAMNSISFQQALAQILPTNLNQTTEESNNQSTTNSSLTSQVLHIVQSKNTNGNQITVVDNAQNTVINNSNAPMLHIVQNKGSHTNSTSNTNPGQNSYGGLSLLDSGLQAGSNQLLHIVNTGTQKNNTAGQLIKRVNLVTNLTNNQGTNEQKMVQFLCKSTDGKSIQLNSPHQRSMVLRLQPIESNVQNNPKQSDSQDLSPTSNGSNSTQVKDIGNPQHEIKSRSVYEENYAKFIQSSNKTVPEKSTTLPKFNQAFGKPVFQEDNQKPMDLDTNNSHLSSINSEPESPECTDNTMNIDHINQISSPPLLLRKSPAQTPQTQPNLVQQIKQTITPMNIQTMHGGVIYTRQIPVNIGGGQTINLITVPSTELLDNDNQKHQGEVKFINQNDIESPIIKIVPHGQNNSNSESAGDEGNNHTGLTNENGQSGATQHQPVLTQMRIKLPMLSKTPQMVSGARVVRPSFFQIQRNVIGGANQPVYQQLVLTAAPPLSQHIRLPQAQTNREVKVTSEGQSSSETQMSTSTLEQLREFDMVLEQVKERSTVQPNPIPNNVFAKLHGSSSDATDGSSVTSTVTESTQQVLYSIGNSQSLNVAYVNRKPNTTFVRSPDSSGIVESPSSSTHIQIPHTVTSESTSNDVSAQPSQPKAAKVSSKSKSRPKSSSSAMKINAVPPKTSSQKPLEDEQTTQRILYILAEYKEQVENSPDKDKPAPRRRTNPPSNPGSSKRKKSSSGSRRHGMRDMSPVLGEDTCRTMGSEDSSCGTSQGDCNESCMDSHSPQDSPRKVVRKLTFDNEPSTPTQPRPQPQRNVIVADGQTITVARGTSGKPTTAVLMPANYLLPVSMVKGGQQIAIVTNRGPKILTVGGEGGTTNALLLQRLIGPAGLKPVLARPGVRHVRLPTAALHNIHTFNLATTTVQPPDSTASHAAGSTPPELVETRVTSSPWPERETQEVKPERDSSPEDTEPWNLPSSADPHDYSYEETVRTENMDRTVLDAIPDRYSPDMEAQRIFDKMFDIDSKKSYIIDSQDDTSRCAYDIDASDCGDKAYHQVVQRRDGSRHHRFAHVAHAAAMRHKYAILEHELRLQGSMFSQKSLSEECEDLGVDSPSASELFPEAELLFGNSPAHEAHQHSHTPQPTVLSQCGIPQPDMDDQIATDHLLQQEIDDQQDLGVTLGLDEGIVTVSEDGMQATIALDQEEFARSHPNTTFHTEPTEDGEIQPFTITGLKGRHITSTIFHATRAPATVLVSAPPTVISHGEAFRDDVINDTRELHLTHTASAIVHSTGNATQVIRRVCWDERRDNRWMDEPEGLIAGDDAKMVAEDNSRDATLESMAGDVDDGNSTPEPHNELYWESNSASERSESRRPLDFSSDSEKCCKSPYEETNSTDSSGLGTHMRLDSVIKDARGIEMSGSADGSSADDAHPIRTYPAKRLYSIEGMERSMTGKTRAGERSPDIMEVRRRASGRGVVKRGCHCCNGSPAPLRPKKSRQKKPNVDFPTH